MGQGDNEVIEILNESIDYLKECLEDLECFGAYSTDRFKEKHCWEETLSLHRIRIQRLKDNLYERQGNDNCR